MNESQSSDDLPNLTVPIFAAESQQLLKKINFYAPQELASLMKISDSLAWKNKQRYSNIINGCTKIYPAIMLFAGEVYRGLDYGSLAKSAKEYVQNTLLILSGFYGVLRAHDKIAPYRLDMSTPLQFDQYDSLYEFWGSRLQDYIIERFKQDCQKNSGDNCLINLASQEYVRSLDLKSFPFSVVTPVFKKFNFKSMQYQVVGILAKYARGLMMRYAAQNQLIDSKELQAFNWGNYEYRADMSTDVEWVFVQTH